MQNAVIRSGGDLKEFASIGAPHFAIANSNIRASLWWRAWKPIRVKALFPVLFVSSVSFCSIPPEIRVHPWLKIKVSGASGVTLPTLFRARRSLAPPYVRSEKFASIGAPHFAIANSNIRASIWWRAWEANSRECPVSCNPLFPPFPPVPFPRQPRSVLKVYQGV
jgi:hypothetical protein